MLENLCLGSASLRLVFNIDQLAISFNSDLWVASSCSADSLCKM